MFTKFSIFSLSLLMVIIVNCDFNKSESNMEANSELADIVNNLRYSLTISPEATDSTETPSDENNDVVVNGKSQCNKSCYDKIPEAYNTCIDEFIKCKNDNLEKCGKNYTQCLRDANVIGKDWDDFKVCKMDCRNRVKFCKEIANQCKNGCNASDGSNNEECIMLCKKKHKICIKDKVCNDYPLICPEKPENPDKPELPAGSGGTLEPQP